MQQIFAQGTRFVDDAGRERTFRGVNVVDKSDFTPGEQIFPLTAEDIGKLRDIGVNVLRLGFTWAKIEPLPNQYNDAYLDSVSDVLDLCAANDIYVFLDMHQDLFSSKTNGDGAPHWAALTDGHAVHPTRFVWAEDYFWGRACHSAFDHFWRNDDLCGVGLQDRFAKCWAHIAQKLGGKAAVIGFDVFNEPFPGTEGGKCFRRLVGGAAKAVLVGKNFRRGSLLRGLQNADRSEQLYAHITFDVLREATRGMDAIIAAFDRTKYAPFLQKVFTAIRQTGTDKLLFLENNYYSNMGVPCCVPPVEIDGKRDPQQVFAPHAYDFMVDTPDYRYASNERVGGMFRAHAQTQQRLHMPVLVGEWGGFGSEDDDKWLDHISFLLSLFEQNKWSHAYWQFGDAFFDSPLLRVFVRPYPVAVCGIIDSYAYDEKARRFTLSFTQEAAGETILCTPFPIRSLTVDGTAGAYDCRGIQTAVQTGEGKHTIIIEF